MKVSNNRRIVESSYLEQKPDREGSGFIFSSLKLIKRYINQLPRRTRLTKDELDDAGIDLDGQRNK
jgi:hypothetical protein